MTLILTQDKGSEEVYYAGDNTFSTWWEKFSSLVVSALPLLRGRVCTSRAYKYVTVKVSDQQMVASWLAVVRLGLDMRPSRSRVEGEGKSMHFHDYDNHLFELHTGTLDERLARSKVERS
jgi:fosfomycin resistance protein FosX